MSRTLRTRPAGQEHYTYKPGKVRAYTKYMVPKVGHEMTVDSKIQLTHHRARAKLQGELRSLGVALHGMIAPS